MLADSPKQAKKTWEELLAAATSENDPEELGAIMEEIFAALEERGQSTSPPQNLAGL